ncbi:MAG: protein kinase, partial [Aquificales bacterium]|nr:protein kinase [Aquificales bacterium]
MTNTPSTPPGDSLSTQSRLQSEYEHEYKFHKGDIIANEYEVVESLGAGGFAEVYHCQTRLGKHWAVKVLTSAKNELREATISAKLEHPHIVEVFTVSKPEEALRYIVFKYIAGQTLEKKLNQAPSRRLALNQSTLQLIREIASAIDYAHTQDIVHRDIKPSNIILDQRGKAYLTDFGLAEVKQSTTKRSALSDDLRQMGGTVPYMSPEQIKGNTLGDKASDLYAFGVTVYEMLTGQLPYRGRDTQIILQIASESSPPLSPIIANPDLPEGIEPVLLCMIDKDATKRYPTAQAFVDELKTVTQSYATANTLYEEATQYASEGKWRKALTAFQQLEKSAPGHKDTKLQIERVKQKVSLLNYYDDARAAIKDGRYQDALDALELLEKVDPEYDVAALREEALAGRKKAEERSIQEQYEQAVQEFEAGDYQAALDTMAVIPEHSDPQGIKQQAEEKVAYQKKLRQLYNEGVEHSRKGEWERALTAFRELNEIDPHYEDVNNRLVSAGHFYELASMLEAAKQALKGKRFTACIDTLDEIKHKTPDYRKADVASLRQKALDRFFAHSQALLAARQFADTLTAVKDLRQRQSDYPGLDALEAETQEGKNTEDLRRQLDELYQQALEQIDAQNYAAALEIWTQIEEQQGDLAYPDQQGVVRQAKNGLYANAITLLNNNPQEALAVWQQLHDFDPDYNDVQKVEQTARQKLSRKHALQKWGVRVGAGVVALVLIFFLGKALFSSIGGGDDGTPTPNSTQMTQTAVALIAAATPTKTQTPTPT